MAMLIEIRRGESPDTCDSTTEAASAYPFINDANFPDSVTILERGLKAPVDRLNDCEEKILIQ